MSDALSASVSGFREVSIALFLHEGESSITVSMVIERESFLLQLGEKQARKLSAELVTMADEMTRRR